MVKQSKYCPRCGRPMVGHPAISRKDNKTEVCSTCGLLEALDALQRSIHKSCAKQERENI